MAGGAQPSPLSYSVVIPTKDRWDDADATLDVVLGQSRLPARIVVADASDPPYEPSPDRAERARSAGVDLLVLRSQPSVHTQRNLGTRRVETPIVLFLDDDVRIPLDYAEVLLAKWEAQGLTVFGGIQGTPAEVPRQSRLGRVLRRLAMLSYVDPVRDAMTLRRSGKVRFVPEPNRDVRVPVLASGATAYRTDLALAHPFDERFAGYTPGGDLEMAARVAAAAPLLQTPDVHWSHLWHPRERVSSTRWYVRGRCETYFRLKRLDRSPPTLAAFGVSLAADCTLALVESIRSRDPAHVWGFVRGVTQTLRDPPPSAEEMSHAPARTVNDA